MPSEIALTNLRLWVMRFKLENFDFESAISTLDKHFVDSGFTGPLAVVLREVIRSRNAIEDREVLKGVAYAVACGVERHVRLDIRRPPTDSQANLTASITIAVNRSGLSDDYKRRVITDFNKHQELAAELLHEALTYRGM